MASGMASCDATKSLISAPDIVEFKDHVGVAYIVCNDYHSEEDSAIGNYGVDRD